MRAGAGVFYSTPLSPGWPSSASRRGGHGSCRCPGRLIYEGLTGMGEGPAVVGGRGGRGGRGAEGAKGTEVLTEQAGTRRMSVGIAGAEGAAEQARGPREQGAPTGVKIARILREFSSTISRSNSLSFRSNFQFATPLFLLREARNAHGAGRRNATRRIAYDGERNDEARRVGSRTPKRAASDRARRSAPRRIAHEAERNAEARRVGSRTRGNAMPKRAASDRARRRTQRWGAACGTTRRSAPRRIALKGEARQVP